MSTCPWAIDIDDCCKSLELEPEDPRVVSVIAQVSQMLTRWSGFAYGGCATLRPLSPCGECRSGCCLSGDCIVLHGVSDVLAVRESGVEVDGSEYHFDAARGILCAVPPKKWASSDPRYNSVGSLEVDVRVGTEPDAWALATATTLACELLRSCMDVKCRLPRNATSVSAHGVVVTLNEDEINLYLPEVAAWVSAVNPARATLPARVFSAEADRARKGLWGR